MHKKLFATAMMLLALGFTFSACQPAAGKEDTTTNTGAVKPPNIVLIISDDQGWTDYGFMGHEQIKTPNLDKLAYEGQTFVRSYLPNSLCAPSLASIATGLYPRDHGVLGNDRLPPSEEKPKDREEWKKMRSERYAPVIEQFRTLNTLPKMLADAGYLSFQTGKWWIGNHKNGGFDLGMTHGDPARGGRHGDFGLKIGRSGMDTLFRYIDYAVEEEKPFFVWYAPYLPHRPHTVPDSILQKYLPVAPSEHIAKYWAMVEWFDLTCGQLIDYIDDKALTDNTLFVYVCDNGWKQLEERSGYTKDSKRSPYDYGMRSPIMFKWSGKITPVFNPHSLATSLDIVPTVLSLLDLEVPDNLEGINVFDEAALAKRETLFGEIYAHDFFSVEESLKYRVAITDPYKLILPNPEKLPEAPVQLFDLVKDPHEQNNLAQEHPDIVAELTQRIQQEWAKK